MRKKRKQGRAMAKPIGRMWWHRWVGEQNVPNGCKQGIAQLKGVSDAADLADRTVLMAGLGAVGGKCFQELARSGVGTLIGVDPDKYDTMSWLTQPIRRQEDASEEKATVQGAAAAAANTAVDVMTARACAQDLPWHMFRQADLLVVAGDNLELLLWMGNMAAALGKPLLEGAVHGETWTAFVRHWDLADPHAACPGCSLGRTQWTMLKSRRGCDPGTINRLGPGTGNRLGPGTGNRLGPGTGNRLGPGTGNRLDTEPTHTLPFVCGTAATLLVGEVLKCLLDGGQPRLAGEELAYCLQSHRVWRTPHDRDGSCRCPHARWTVVDVDLSPSQRTLRPLVDQFADSQLVQVRGELPWISFAPCRRCGTWASVRRFGTIGSRVGHCTCGGTLVAVPTGMRSVIPADDVRACLDVPLDALGLMSGDALRISFDQQSVCLFLDDLAPQASTNAPAFSVAAQRRGKE